MFVRFKVEAGFTKDQEEKPSDEQKAEDTLLKKNGQHKSSVENVSSSRNTLNNFNVARKRAASLVSMGSFAGGMIVDPNDQKNHGVW